MSNPDIGPKQKTALVHDLMAARRAVKNAKASGDKGRKPKLIAQSIG
jgi:hypothetical protein